MGSEVCKNEFNKETQTTKSRTWSQAKDCLRNHKVSMANKWKRSSTDGKDKNSGKVFKYQILSRQLDCKCSLFS